MKIKFFFSVIFFFVAFQISSQNITLVEDFIFGPEGSFDGYFNEFKGKLLYIGHDEDGEEVILQYDKETDKITTVLVNEDVEGDIAFIITSSEKLVVVTIISGFGKNIYISEESDLSDLTKVYDSGDSFLVNFGFTDNSSLMFVEYNPNDLIEITTNFKIIDPNNNVITLFEDLENDPFSYTFLILDNYYFIAPRLNYVDNKAIIVYDTELRDFVPFNTIVPNYIECGLFEKFQIRNERMIYYECLEKVLFDVVNESYVDPPEQFVSITYATDNFFYYTVNKNMFRRNKLTNEEELFIENYTTFRDNGEQGIAIRANDNKLEIIHYNYQTMDIDTYQTDLASSESIATTTLAMAPSGIHFGFYSNDHEEGSICKIKNQNFTTLGPLYKIPWSQRIIVLEEDLYFSHEDPIVGSELFKIDYDVNSTKDIATEESLVITPNPVLDHIELKHPNGWKPLTTSIFDFNGNLIKNSIKEFSIDARYYPAGLYVLHSSYTNGKTLAARFIVE